jgi:Mce-associated membrane protein
MTAEDDRKTGATSVAERRAAAAKEKARRAAELAELAEQAAREAAEAAAEAEAADVEDEKPDTDAEDAQVTQDEAEADTEVQTETGDDEAEDDEKAAVSASAKPDLVKADKAADEADEAESEESAPKTATEDEKHEKHEKHAKARRRRVPVPLPREGSRKLVVLGLVAVLGLAGVGWLWMKKSELDATEAASKQAAYAATQAAQSISSYDYRTVESDMRKATDYTTGGFRKQFETQAERVRTLAPQQQAMVTGTAVKTAIEDISSTKGTVLVFLNQQTVKTTQTDKNGQPQRLPSQFTLRMHMTKVGDRWLASQVEVL